MGRKTRQNTVIITKLGLKAVFKMSLICFLELNSQLYTLYTVKNAMAIIKFPFWQIKPHPSAQSHCWLDLKLELDQGLFKLYP